MIERVFREEHWPRGGRPTGVPQSPAGWIIATAAQVALTLRLLDGLPTAEIAHAFLVPEPTMAQRLVRAKSKIRDASAVGL